MTLQAEPVDNFTALQQQVQMAKLLVNARWERRCGLGLGVVIARAELRAGCKRGTARPGRCVGKLRRRAQMRHVRSRAVVGGGRSCRWLVGGGHG
jgi:hypothetical protein